MHVAKSYGWLFWSLAVVGFTFDQASKYGVFYHLDNGQVQNSLTIIPDVFSFSTRYVTDREAGQGLLPLLRSLNSERLPGVNHGALFGWGTNWGWDANSFFAVVSVAAALAIAFWSTRRNTREDWFLSLALGLILAGTLGNLYDRLVFGGVRDFLHWYYLIDWPVFNFADCCLVCGAGALLLQAFFTEPVAPRSPSPEQAEVVEPEVAARV